jgi:hypothetical protein
MLREPSVCPAHHAARQLRHESGRGWVAYTAARAICRARKLLKGTVTAACIFNVLSQHRDMLGDAILWPKEDTPSSHLFAQGLASHLHAKEQLLFPVLRAAGWRHVTFEVLAEHMVLKRALADLLTASHEGGDAARVLLGMHRALGARYTTHLLRLQRVLDRCLSAGEQQLLALELSDALQRDWPAHHGAAAAALVEEARLVLSSLEVPPPERTALPDSA